MIDNSRFCEIDPFFVALFVKSFAKEEVLARRVATLSGEVDPKNPTALFFRVTIDTLQGEENLFIWGSCWQEAYFLRDEKMIILKRFEHPLNPLEHVLILFFNFTEDDVWEAWCDTKENQQKLEVHFEHHTGHVGGIFS